MNLGQNVSALKIAAAYLLFGTLWIFGTDKLLNIYGQTNPEAVVKIQVYKGVLYVVLSTTLIYLLANTYFNKQALLLAQAEGLAHNYKALYESVIDGVVEYDHKTDTALLNAKLRTDLGYPSETVAGFYKQHLARIHPDDRRRVAKAVALAAARGGTPWQLEYRYLWKDNSYHTVLSRGYFVTHPQSGTVERYAGTFQDVSQIKHIQAHLADIELQYHQKLGKESLRVQEAERGRLAMELHDNIGQLLVVGQLYTEQMMATNEAPLASKVHQVIQDACTEIRQLSATMKPPRFSETTVSQAVDVLAARIMQAKGIHIAVNHAKLSEQHLSDEHKLIIYRIVQEQLTNIVKHARASSVQICLGSTPTEVHIKIADNGIGCGTAVQPSGIGLQNIRNRVELYRGLMRIQSAPEGGCVLLASFSLA